MVKPEKHKIGVGICSMLMILIVLTFTVFAVLSFVSARNDLRWTQRLSQQTADYYAAEKDAASRIAALDKSLRDYAEAALDAAAYGQMVTKLQAAVDGVELADSGGDVWRLTLTVPVNEVSSLQSELDIAKNPYTGEQWTLAAQRLVSLRSYEEDYSFDDFLNIEKG